MLNNTVTYLLPTLGFLATDISERCLCATVVNSLINARIEPEVITFISCWRSDEILQYIHVQKRNLMKDYADCMLQHSYYNLIPNQHTPMH